MGGDGCGGLLLKQPRGLPFGQGEPVASLITRREMERRGCTIQMENLDGNYGMSGKSTVQRRRGLLATHEGLGDSGQCGQTWLLTAIHVLPRSHSPLGSLFSDIAVVQQEGVGVHIPIHACCEKELIY